MKLVVLIPAYNAQLFIKQTVESILSQNVNVKLIVTDDNSTDNTYKILSQYKEIKLIRNSKNMGTYYSLNRSLHEASLIEDWTHYAIHGADDISLPNRFVKQLDMLGKSDDRILATGCRFNRVDYRTKRVYTTNPNTNESMLVMKREVFDLLGYFDNARVACDTEFKQRLLHARPGCINSIPDVLVNAYLHETNLTKKIPIGGTKRRNYVAEFQAKHQKMKQNNNFYQDFKP